MMKFIEWINLKIGFAKKEDFEYECTYAWSVVMRFCLFLVITLFNLGLFLWLNCMAFAFEYMPDQLLFGANIKQDDESLLQILMILANICILNLIALTKTKIGKVANYCIEFVLQIFATISLKFGQLLNVVFSPIVKLGSVVINYTVIFPSLKIRSILKTSFNRLMDRYCNKVVK